MRHAAASNDSNPQPLVGAACLGVCLCSQRSGGCRAQEVSPRRLVHGFNCNSHLAGGEPLHRPKDGCVPSFGGRANGALTRTAIDALAASPGTAREWHTLVRKKLPSADYPQTPQLSGSRLAMKSPLF